MNTGGYKPLNELQKKQVKKIARGAAKRSQEKKRVVGGGKYSDIIVGNGYAINPLYNISQGTGIGNRIGTAISVDTIKFKWDFTLLTTAYTVQMKMIIYMTEEETFTTGSTPTQITNPNLQTSLPLLGNTTLQQVQLQQVDWNQCTLLYEKEFTFNTPGPTATPNWCGSHLLKLKGRKFQYLSDSADYMEGKNLYVAWIFDSSVGTVGTTIIGNLTHSYLVTYRE